MVDNEHVHARPEFEYEMSAGESPSEAVVRAVSASSGADPVPDPDAEFRSTLDPLHGAVDPDALDSVVGGSDGVRVTFRYHGHRVTVRGDRRVIVGRLGAGGGESDA